MKFESHGTLEIDNDRQADDPTPNEIRLACLQIQATWTEEERRYRAGVRDGFWCTMV